MFFIEIVSRTDENLGSVNDVICHCLFVRVEYLLGNGLLGAQPLHLRPYGVQHVILPLCAQPKLLEGQGYLSKGQEYYKLMGQAERQQLFHLCSSNRQPALL